MRSMSELDVRERLGLDPWPVVKLRAIRHFIRAAPVIGEDNAVKSIYMGRCTGRTTRMLVQAVANFSQGMLVFIKARTGYQVSCLVEHAREMAVVATECELEEAISGIRPLMQADDVPPMPSGTAWCILEDHC